MHVNLMCGGKIMTNIEKTSGCQNCDKLNAENERLHAYLNALDFPIFAAAKDLTTSYVNDNSLNDFMNMTREDIMWKDYESLHESTDIEQEYLKESKEKNRQVFLTGKPIVNELDRVTIDGHGRQRLMATSRYPVFDKNRNVTEVVSYARDVTCHYSENKVYKKLVESFADGSSNKHKIMTSKFFSLSYDGCSQSNKHDNLCDLIARCERDNDNRDEYIKLVKNKVQHEQTPVQLKFIVADYLKNITYFISRHSIEILADTALVKNHVVADEESIKSVLSQLVDNAIQSFSTCVSRDKEKTISICMTLNYNVGKEKEGELNISVLDNGCGIAKDRHEKIFFPYVSDCNDSSVGLGLAIVKERVDRLGGKLKLISEPNNGTEFFVTLPCSFM